MDLVTCPNCITAYGSVHGRCPTCEADHHGEGARLELDAETRTAVARHGGLYGGILRVDDLRHVLWCTRGLCLVSEEIGLAWHVGLGTRIDGVEVGGDAVRVSLGARPVELDLEDGSRRTDA